MVCTDSPISDIDWSSMNCMLLATGSRLTGTQGPGSQQEAPPDSIQFLCHKSSMIASVMPYKQHLMSQICHNDMPTQIFLNKTLPPIVQSASELKHNSKAFQLTCISTLGMIVQLAAMLRLTRSFGYSLHLAYHHFGPLSWRNTDIPDFVSAVFQCYGNSLLFSMAPVFFHVEKIRTFRRLSERNQH